MVTALNTKFYRLYRPMALIPASDGPLTPANPLKEEKICPARHLQCMTDRYWAAYNVFNM
jgi:hypothetical protein